MRRFLTLFIILILISCTSIKNTTNIHSNLQASEYNSLSANYLTRPTFVQIDELSNGYTIITIKMDMYGAKQSAIAIGKRNVDLHVTLIDKYLKWEELARDRGDILSKEIGEAESWKNSSTIVYNQYQFHSGNKLNHYLVIDSCALSNCVNKPQYYNRENALKLKELLLKFKDGVIGTKKLDSVYN